MMDWSKAQREAIETRGKNILVSAAAGSGKTAVLVERIKELIIKDEIGIDRMLVVTFSNAAASEMRERILSAITDEIETGSDQEAFLRKQLNLVNRSNISTFHAFAMEVIRRYFYLIEADPNFKICDEPNKVILQSDAMEELFEELFQSGDAGFLAFLNQYAASKNENDVKTMVLETHRFIQSLPEPLPWLAQKISDLSIDKADFFRGPLITALKESIKISLERSLSSFIKTRSMILQHGITSLETKCDRDIEQVEKLLVILRAAPSNIEATDLLEKESIDLNDFALELQHIRFEVFKASREDEAEFSLIKDQVKVLRDKGKDLIKRQIIEKYFVRTPEEQFYVIQQTKEAANYLFKMVETFDSLYRYRKSQRGLLDFSDIEHYALEILKTPQAASEYREKFQYIFIDEYQDSNIVQETLIACIKRTDNVFMVGDVKQSIYKFRLAEPELFINKYEEFRQPRDETNVKIDLNLNFRSKLEVIDSINNIFKVLMQKDTAGLAYDDTAALYPGSQYDGPLSYPTELHLVDDRKSDDLDLDDEINEMKKAELEASSVATIIKGCLGKPLFDFKSKTERLTSYKDIIILFRSAKGYADIYSEILSREGIPNFADMGDGYFDTMEIGVFMNLLRIIDNKKQDIPLLSVLRSPIFDYDTSELIIIRLQKKGVPFFNAIENYAVEGSDPVLRIKSAATLKKIDDWKTIAAFMNLEELLWKLMGDSGYYDFIGAIPGGLQRQANLRALVDKGILFQKSHMKGLFGFINYIDLIKKDKVPYSQMQMISENDDVVRIMTVHKSKGLEFPVVLVCGLGKRFNKEPESYKVAMHKHFGIGLRYSDPENFCQTKTLTQIIIEEEKKKEALAEEIRILYVALTRAKDRLILVGSSRNIHEMLNKAKERERTDIPDAGSFLDWIFIAAQVSTFKIFYHDRNTVQMVQQKEVLERVMIRQELEFGFQDEFPKELLSEIGKKLSWHYHYSDVLNLQSKFSVSEIIKNKSQSPQSKQAKTLSKTPQFLLDSTILSASDRGTILHRVMEQIPLIQGMGKEKIEQFLATLVDREILTKQQISTVDIRKIIDFFNSDIGIRICAAKKVFREASFNIAMEPDWIPTSEHASSNEKVIVQGTIDCCFIEADHYILLDYKTDSFWADAAEDIESMADRYKPQLLLYKEALERSRHIAVKEAYVYLFSLSKTIKIDL